ncbi:MAG TPA: hypothetical protein HA262_09040 [Methanosarcina sp.]|nr:hypothetical protein [Methanosarcina sp.]
MVDNIVCIRVKDFKCSIPILTYTYLCRLRLKEFNATTPRTTITPNLLPVMVDFIIIRAYVEYFKSSIFIVIYANFKINGF